MSDSKKKSITKYPEKKRVRHNSKTKPPRPDVTKTNPPKKD